MRSLVGGAAVPEALIRAFDQARRLDHAGLGHDRDLAARTVSYPRAELRDAGDDERFRRAAMAGMPVPLVDAAHPTDDGDDAPWDGKTMGEIQVRGPVHHRHLPRACRSTRRQVHRRRLAAHRRRRDVDALGFVRITDRTKDLIKSGGEWISSVDLENALMAHPAIAEAAVIAIPRREVERAAAGLRRLQAGPAMRRRRRARPRTCCSHGFAKWQLPDRYEVIDAIPRTSTGKFWKLKLREQFPR